MIRWFWAMLAVNAVIGMLVFAALPFGPDLLYGIQVGSLLASLALLGWREHGRPGVPPPDHPVWRNPQAPR